MEQQPQDPQQYALDRMSWLHPDTVKAIGPKAALGMAFAEDVIVRWKLHPTDPDGDYVISSIRGVTEKGRLFVAAYGGRAAFKGMTETDFGKCDQNLLCFKNILPAYPRYDDAPDDLVDAAYLQRIHTFYRDRYSRPNTLKPMALDPEGRPVYSWTDDPDLQQYPHADQVDLDARLVIENDVTVEVQAVSRLGAVALRDLETSLQRKDCTTIGTRGGLVLALLRAWGKDFRLSVLNL